MRLQAKLQMVFVCAKQKDQIVTFNKLVWHFAWIVTEKN